MSGRELTKTSSPKFMVPMLRVAISAPATSEPSRSSTPIPTAPPVEHWTTTSLPAARMRSTISRKWAASCEGRPSGPAGVQVDHRRPVPPGATAAAAISSGV